MRLLWLTLVVICILLIQVSLVSSQDELYWKCSGDNYTSNSAYHRNLVALLDSLPRKISIDYGFYNFSLGKGKDTVNVVALCRGDLSQATCLECLSFSTTALPNLCPTQKEAIVWYDNCMLRYSNRWIFHSVEATALYMWSRNNASEDTFADKDTRIYSLVQCTPDLTELQCTNCLNETYKILPFTNFQQGGRVLGPSCNIRYEMYPFYDIQPPTGTNVIRPSGQPIKQPNGRHIRKIIWIVASTLGSVALFTSIFILVILKRRKNKLQRKEHYNFLSNDAHDMKSMESLLFDFETIRVATNNFNTNSNKLGQGGFGSVYKGNLMDGKEIAVKRLAAHSGQGDLEFTNEVILLAKLQHRNLVRFLGYCLKGNERLLIYEFVSNSSLDHFLFDSVKRSNLDWDARCKIITGIAKGLLYLHEDSRLTIIHRDLKPGNILLDDEMCPKIADFGLARMFNLNQTHGATTRIVGTYGYMAPEYAMHGKFSVKSDVYSFGILLLEIISGQKNSRFCIGDTPYELTSFAWENWKAGTPINIIDPMILKGNMKDILRSIHIGLLCVQDSVSARPTTASVVLMLSSASLALPFPTKPAVFTSEENKETTSGSGGENSTPSVNRVSISDMLPR